MKEKIIKILQNSANVTHEEIALRLNLPKEEVSKLISELENELTVLGYKAIINEDYLDKQCPVRAIIEVRITPQRDGGYNKIAERISKFPEVSNVYLMSGGYDLSLQVDGASLQEVSQFVASKLSTIDGIISCATHFILKKYKESGFCYNKEEEYERLSVTP